MPAPGDVDGLCHGRSAASILLSLLLGGTSLSATVQQAPSCDAGPTQVVTHPADRVTLPGSASDDGSIVRWQWTQLSGVDCRIEQEDDPAAVVISDELGPAVFQLEVWDDQGLSARDEVRVLWTDDRDDATARGKLERWHRVDLEFQGVLQAEGDTTDNPFLDARLDVVFARQGGASFVIPGFFAADGNAADSGATAGRIWRVHFTPPATGRWHWWAHFRRGSGVAAGSPDDGVPAEIDGLRGRFDVGHSSATGRDLRAHGTLRHEGHRYYRFAGSREWYLKIGANSPETLLSYQDFDGTPRALHTYAPHLDDFDRFGGGPTWRGGQGKSLIGALSYLADAGANAVYFLVMNVYGDGDDVWPWTTAYKQYRYDCSKLDQWERVFQHMERRGLVIHMVTQETENDDLLDGGNLGPERRVFYRELIARFAHHNAVIWNLGEENTNSPTQVESFDRFFREHDVYGHPLVLHTYAGKKDRDYPPLLDRKVLDGASLQIYDPSTTNQEVAYWIQESIDEGHPWVCSVDETGPGDLGVVPDSVDFGHDLIRQRALWGGLLAGAAGCEWYFGYAYPNDDRWCEDWRSRSEMWRQSKIALDFFRDHEIPFWDMHGAEELTNRYWDHCLAEPGERYVVLRHKHGNCRLDLESHTPVFEVRWYDSRNGGPLQQGTVDSVQGPGVVHLGNPPGDLDRDWVALVRRRNSPPVIQDFWIQPNPLVQPTPVDLRAIITDPDGPDDLKVIRMYFWDPQGVALGWLVLPRIGEDEFGFVVPRADGAVVGDWTYSVMAVDRRGERVFSPQKVLQVR